MFSCIIDFALVFQQGLDHQHAENIARDHEFSFFKLSMVQSNKHPTKECVLLKIFLN